MEFSFNLSAKTACVLAFIIFSLVYFLCFIYKSKPRKRSRVTVRIMKQIYPDKRVSISDLNLTKEELIVLLRDIKKYKGFNTERNIQTGEIEIISLSSMGKRFIESNDKPMIIKTFIKNNYKWVITTLISAITALIKCK